MSGVSKGLAHFNDKGEVLREVAQLGRVLGLGPRGRRFESCLPDAKDFVFSFFMQKTFEN